VEKDKEYRVTYTGPSGKTEKYASCESLQEGLRMLACCINHNNNEMVVEFRLEKLELGKVMVCVLSDAKSLFQAVEAIQAT